jgi:hypothetical protein
VSRGRISAGASLAAASLVATLALAQATDPIAPLEVVKGRLGWGGLDLGMSLVQIERKVGGTLAIDARRDRPVCSAYAADAEVGDLHLVLGFPSARPGARLESIWVQFEGYQVAASAGDLGAALRGHVPGVTYVGSAPGLDEADDPRPTYAVPVDPPAVVRFAPRDGVQLALRSCLP